MTGHGKFRKPHFTNALNRFRWNLKIRTTPPNTTHMQHLISVDNTAGLGEYPVCHTVRFPATGGSNRHFQAKFTTCKNLHIIETTVSIPTKLCRAMTITKCSSWMVQMRTSQIQDGERPPYWKINKPLCLANGLSDRHEMTRWCILPLRIHVQLAFEVSNS